MKLFYFLIMTCFSAIAADDIVGPQKQTCFMESTRVGEKTILPGKYAVCAALGIAKPECADMFMPYGGSQTDKALWYTGTESSPDNKTDCYGAVPIERYTMIDGRRGTTYACIAPPDDDEITAEELKAITRYAEHLNSIGKKTLADHEAALNVKRLAKYIESGK
jgi:hypothetical protein